MAIVAVSIAPSGTESSSFSRYVFGSEEVSKGIEEQVFKSV